MIERPFYTAKPLIAAAVPLVWSLAEKREFKVAPIHSSIGHVAVLRRPLIPGFPVTLSKHSQPSSTLAQHTMSDLEPLTAAATSQGQSRLYIGEYYQQDNRSVSTIYLDDLISVRSDSAISSDQGSLAEGSVITYHSSVDGFLFKDAYGRIFTNQSDSYYLPGDGPEHRRLDLQHNLLRLHIDGLYMQRERVEYVLRDEPFRSPGILDIGTGSGRWAVDMARQFPHTSVIGMDLVPPIIDVAEIAPNCRFEVDDANLPMDHYRQSFDYVHMRCAVAGILDFQSFLHQVAQTLQPCGVLQLVSAIVEVVGEDLLFYPLKTIGEQGFSWTQWMFAEFLKAHERKGHPGYTSVSHWHGWLENDPHYTDIVTQNVYVPFGPWKDRMSELEEVVAKMLNEDLVHFVHAIKPTLLNDGKTAEEVEFASRNAVQELQEGRIHGYIRWQYTTATRTRRPWREDPHDMY